MLKQERGSGPTSASWRSPRASRSSGSRPRTSAVRSARSRRSTCPARSRPAASRSSSRRAETLRRLKVRDAELPVDTDGDVEELQDAVAAHPLHDAPGADVALRAAWQADRIARDIARLERRVSSRNESLARQFDRVLGVLRTWGYVEEWSLTDAGQLLTRLNSEGELVVAEARARGPPRRDRSRDDGRGRVVLHVPAARPRQQRGDAAAPLAEPGGRPPQPGARRRLARPAPRRARGAACPRRAGPIPGFTAAIYAWVKGEDLADVLEDEEMTGGDFVRNVKQTIDLLRQIADVVPERADRRDRPRRGRRVPARRHRRVEHREGARPRDQAGRGVGRPDDAAPDLEVRGGDADLAPRPSAGGPGVLVRFRPGPDVGPRGRGRARTRGVDLGVEVTLDLLRLADGHRRRRR